jgi:hypothetical protein
MQRIGHVDALPPGSLDRKVHDVTRLRRLRDEAFDGEPPVLEAVCLKPLELIARQRGLVGERRFEI